MDYLIETSFQGPGFVAVPNHVLDDERLSPEAIGVLVWFARKPVGWIARTSAVRERFGIGKDRWQRIARELRAVGAIRVERIRTAAGVICGARFVICWPEPVTASAAGSSISRETRPVDHKPGNPAAGKPAKLSRETRQVVPENPAPYKDKEKDKGPAALSSGSEKGLRGGRCASRPVDAWSLSRFQRARVLAGQSVVVAGSLVEPGSPRAVALCQVLRGQSAMEGASA
jgi:hypothetical protein